MDGVPADDNHPVRYFGAAAGGGGLPYVHVPRARTRALPADPAKRRSGGDYLKR
ncbi:hypothetical protein JKF63_02046 [Porcisia hertigi]|uniref:Uncharacterized protein n=1 Tax=Porcisia hertigi TaxID=2761500 RepID=A0A836HNU5_9TRYP|nr:hypothetical protein JKF63_02046 [Porcisia hertigi]